ncbi:MAG: hypothetical protein GXP42_12035 [Chloroflexi bacterium]|nr:hypothetical protein [Chloroflexota bacterium]
MNALRSLSEYESFVYTLAQRYPSIVRSTLTVIRRGATVAVLRGEVEFNKGVRLSVREKLSFVSTPGTIKGYGYEVWQNDELLYWYDSQPHPNDSTLATTHPHHKHVPPDIKHHRLPAPGLSFSQANLPYLIEEIEQTLLAENPSKES